MNPSGTPSADPADRTQLLIGSSACQRLHNGFAVVVGLGAVGGYAVEALARAGVGFLRLVDGDTIEPSNLNRQLLATHATLGRLKTEVALERCRSINPGCVVDPLPFFFDSGCEERLFAPLRCKAQPDLIIDCIDSVPAKSRLLAECLKRRLPVFSSMGAARRLDPFALRTADLSQTTHCPLAKAVRTALRKAGYTTGVTAVFSCEPPLPQPPGSPLGSLSTLPALFGIHLAHLAIQHLISEEPHDPVSAAPSP